MSQENNQQQNQNDPLGRVGKALGNKVKQQGKNIGRKITQKIAKKAMMTTLKLVKAILAKTAVVWVPVLLILLVGIIAFLLIYALPKALAEETASTVNEKVSAFFGFSEEDEETYDGDVFKDYQEAAATWDEGLSNYQRKQAEPYAISWGVLAGVDRLRNDPHMKSGNTFMKISDDVEIKVDGVYPPEEFIPIYRSAAEEYDVDWEILSAIHSIESVYSTYPTGKVSSVGAEGPMQFMPCTFVGWDHDTCNGKGQGNISHDVMRDLSAIEDYGGYGVDGNGDGKADIWNELDAVYSAANFLSSNGYSDNKEDALYQYNQADWYVQEVLASAEQIRQMHTIKKEEGEVEEYDLSERDIEDYDFFDLEDKAEELITPDPEGTMEVLGPQFTWEEKTATHTWEEEECKTTTTRESSGEVNTSTSCHWEDKTQTETVKVLVKANTYEGTYTHDYQMVKTESSEMKFASGKARNYEVTQPQTSNITSPSKEERMKPFYEHLAHFNITNEKDIHLVIELIEMYDDNYLDNKEGLDNLNPDEYPEIEGSNDWRWPTLSTDISSTFGPRPPPCSTCSSYHGGTDVRAVEPGVDGDPIFAMEEGKVSFTTSHPAAGNYINIQHDNNIKTRYLHLHSVYVSAGEKVEKGDIIGTMGNTGSSTGTHLHFELHVNGEKKDPLHYFPDIN
ncbi:peptidoglycan DD-metalloendopeptidase family protein [Salibacterium aidingense]|uniref:peptidoglycan DD-metalloendopeptidase family protein n=1 Tax=Salibacterium aidingense TaxID=384933 RepID=UPI0004072DBA|nr:peptidoglycan DD-metalloendopeptidase family protein [Salibacterium aidingense]